MFLHEIKQTFADPRRLIFVFGASLAYLILFAMLYSPNIVKNIPTIIFDADNTKISREFLRGFDDSDGFAIIGYAACEEDMRRALIDKAALAAIEVPKNFSRDIAHGSAEFLYMVNGSNIIVTSVTSSAAQNISADFSDKIAARRAATALGSNVNDLAKKISPVQTRLRVLGNPIQGYTRFFLIGLAMAAFQQGILFALGASIFGDRSQKIFSAWKLLAFKVIFYWLMSMAAFAMILAAIEHVAEIPIKFPLVDALILGGAFIFAVESLCVLTTRFFVREVNFIRAATMYPVPAFILSGYTFPAESMGASMNFAAKFFPMSYMSNNLREMFLTGATTKLFVDVRSLILIGAACLILTALFSGKSFTR